MIGETVMKIAWIFPELDFFSKLKPVSIYLMTGSNMKNMFKIILNVFFKYIFYVCS